MTEKQLQDLGFEKIKDADIIEMKDITEGEPGVPMESPHYYYVLELTNGLELISNGSEEVEDGGEWYVDFFDTYPPIRLTDAEEVQVLVNIIKKNKISDITEVDGDLLIDSIFEDEDFDAQIDQIEDYD